MISNDNIIKIVNDCKEKGEDVKSRDIAYVLLCGRFDDKNLAYRIIFGLERTDLEISDYLSSKKLEVLKEVLSKNNIFVGERKSESNESIAKEITFEENREALINLLDTIKEKADNGEIEMKDAIKMETDIRTKLNDKFSVQDESMQQYVIVNTKFNHICEYTGHECWLQTKEFAKEHWGLFELDEAKDKLKKEYDIIPKGK